MKDRQNRVHCTSIFKDRTNIRKPLSSLWAEVINQLEQTKYTPSHEKLDEIGHNGQAQNHPCQSKDAEVSDK